jgi:hypothetical protein
VRSRWPTPVPAPPRCRPSSRWSQRHANAKQAGIDGVGACGDVHARFVVNVEFEFSHLTTSHDETHRRNVDGRPSRVNLTRICRSSLRWWLSPRVSPVSLCQRSGRGSFGVSQRATWGLGLRVTQRPHAACCHDSCNPRSLAVPIDGKLSATVSTAFHTSGRLIKSEAMSLLLLQITAASALDMSANWKCKSSSSLSSSEALPHQISSKGRPRNFASAIAPKCKTTALALSHLHISAPARRASAIALLSS